MIIFNILLQQPAAGRSGYVRVNPNLTPTADQYLIDLMNILSK